MLLLLGKQFSKFHLFWQFHLYDFLFIILVLISLPIFLRRNERFWIRPLIALLGLSLVYFIYSYLCTLGPLQYMVRHYALFIYMGGSYVIVGSFIQTDNNDFNIKFIILIGLVSALIQILYHLFNFVIITDYWDQLFFEFNYLSLMIFPGLFVLEAFILVYDQRLFRKCILVLFIILLNMTMGHHSSAVLCALLIPVVYLLFSVPKPLKVVGIIILVIAIIPAFKLFPQLHDHNSLWRLIYWEWTLQELLVDNYGIFGNGFGGKFTSDELLSALRTELNSPWMELKPKEQYLSPMHNSLITLAFHVGIIPALLLVVPLKGPILYFLNSGETLRDKRMDFMVLALLVMMAWASFHVVLELPHSSAFFWLVYFSAVYLFKQNTNS